MQNKNEILKQCISNYMQMHKNRPAYCEYLRTKGYAYEAILEHFVGDRVLELGSDGAATSAFLARVSKHLDIVDMQDKIAHLMAKDEVLARANFIKSLWQEYKPKLKYSDILLTDSLEHIADDVELLKIISGWLETSKATPKRGGLHIVVPNALSLHRLIGVKMGFLSSPYELNENDIASGHERVYDYDSLKKSIKAAGLEIVHMQGIQLKPLTDSQLVSFSQEYKDALASMSGLLNEHCAEIYALCQIK